VDVRDVLGLQQRAEQRLELLRVARQHRADLRVDDVRLGGLVLLLHQRLHVHHALGGSHLRRLRVPV